MLNTKDTTSKILFLGFLILLGIFSRVLPHPPNFTAIAAVALLAGSYFNNRILAFAIPLTAMLLSDLYIGFKEKNLSIAFHDTILAVYIAFALTVGLGIWISKNTHVYKITGGALAGSVLFFLITNFAVWYTGSWYTKDFSGLLMCYTAAIPFFQYTIAGDLFFTALLFGSYHFASSRYPQLIAARS